MNPIINIETVRLIAQNYSTLDYFVKLKDLLRPVFPAENFDNLTKYELHKLLNDLLIENYNGEEVLKYKLFECHYRKKDIIGAFEIKVNNSRVDFLTINGQTTSYEIKSELDNLSKLKKQMADYLLAFEYNYLVIDESHIEKAYDLLPRGFGLWSYKNGKYLKLETAALNKKIDPEMQLRLLAKKELLIYFPESEGKIKKIIQNYKAADINSTFKRILKDRYRGRWTFLKSNQANIFPIDIQFFFNANIKPDSVYYH